MAATPLTDLVCKNAKPGQRPGKRPDGTPHPADGKPYKLADGKGLYLQVQPTGGKLWRYDYAYLGKRKTLSYGPYPDVSLERARELHRAARQELAAGLDPMVRRRQAERDAILAAGTTFEVVAREWLAMQIHWSASYRKAVTDRLERDIFPWVGGRPIAEILPAELLAVLQRVVGRGAAETARRAKEVCGNIFAYAVATSRAKTNPVEHLKKALPPSTKKKKHFAAITDPAKMARLLQAMYKYEGAFVTRCLLHLSSLLFQRPTELREMQWPELDLDGRGWGTPMWEIPAEREGNAGDTKITRTGWEAHLVPLPRQAVELLRDLHQVTGRSRYVFRSPTKPQQPLSEGAARQALAAMGFKGSASEAAKLRNACAGVVGPYRVVVSRADSTVVSGTPRCCPRDFPTHLSPA